MIDHWLGAQARANLAAVEILSQTPHGTAKPSILLRRQVVEVTLKAFFFLMSRHVQLDAHPSQRESRRCSRGTWCGQRRYPHQPLAHLPATPPSRTRPDRGSAAA